MIPLRLRTCAHYARFRGRGWRRRRRRRSGTLQGWVRAAGLLALLLTLAPWAARGEDPAARAGAAAERAALDSLVRTERAFAARSVAKGMRDAFLAYLADSSVIFRPLAVSGRRSWETRQAPTGTLIWEPSYAEVSTAGDLGYTTGPWEYRAAGGGATAYGHFISVWRRQGDGRWRVELDIGVSHAKTERGVGSGDFAPGPEAVKAAAGDATDKTPPAAPKVAATADSSAQADLETLDRDYSRAATDSGLAVAFAERAIADVRLNREGAPPVTGLAAASAALDSVRGAITWIPQGVGIAGSRDLGYTYGVAEHLAAPGAVGAPDSSVYLHVWRKGEKGWKLALAVENPLAKPAAK